MKADVLFTTFNSLGSQLQLGLRNEFEDSCPGRSMFDRDKEFIDILYKYVYAVRGIHREGRSLKEVQIEMVNFSYSLDSLSNFRDIRYELIQPTIPERYISVTSFVKADTIPLLMEAIRVLSAGCSAYGLRTIRGCNFGGHYPYVEVEPQHRSDSFRVRVGLRLESVCTDSMNYAVVLGDTVMYHDLAWADFKFHKNRLRGLDTLWVESCVGDWRTGHQFCQDRGVLVAW